MKIKNQNLIEIRFQNPKEFENISPFKNSYKILF